jgi:hypothetical protein
MIIVRITGWSSGISPTILPTSVRDLLEEAGVEKADMERTANRLLNGKFVDVYFDLGEHAAAKTFMRNLHAAGLKSELFDEQPTWFPKSSPRVLKTLLGCLIVSGAVAWLFGTGHLSTRFIGGYFLAVLVFLIIVVPRIGGRRSKSDQQIQRERNLIFWLRLGALGLIVLVQSVLQEPWLAVVLVTVVAGGIVSALIIRRANRGT